MNATRCATIKKTARLSIVGLFSSHSFPLSTALSSSVEEMKVEATQSS